MSYQFDSSKNQFIYQDINLDISNMSYTAVIDVKWTAGGGYAFWLGKANAAGNRIGVLRNTGSNALQINAAGSVSFTGLSDPGLLPLNTWVRIIFGIDANSSEVFFTLTGAPTIYTSGYAFSGIEYSRWAIGCNATSSPNSFIDGFIANPGIFPGIVLSQVEIADLLTGKNPIDIGKSNSYLPLVDGLRDWEDLISNPVLSGSDNPVLSADNPNYANIPNGYKEIIVGSAAAGIDEWGYRNDPIDQYGTIDDDSFDQFGDKVTGIYENQNDQPGNIPAFFLEVEPNGIAENQITSVDVGATGQRLQVGIYGDNGGYGEFIPVTGRGGKNILKPFTDGMTLEINQ